MGAFVFAAQMINFSIPGTGSSGHLCGGLLLAALLGPQAAFLAMIGVLLIQCLVFADGGLLALGCNIWNMAFYGCFVGYYLFWRPMMKNGLGKKKIVVAAILGSVVTLQMGAFSVSLETLASGITDLPFTTFLSMMQPIHLVIGLVEGLITSAVLVFLYEARPEMLMESRKSQLENRLTLRKTLLVLCVGVVMIAGGLSLVASSDPDGLEWSIEKLTGSTELESDEQGIYNTADKVQKTTALLPDYQFKDSDTVTGTSISGVLGSTVVLVVCAGVCFIISRKRKKRME